ncbi:hypothetical protein WN944_017123 [Citrus x changshan-huyou]|uniref:Uncharacterized protein n=1 Tax=Citrus x changshan-huyou TaxID=2935761 RepID=A0AAP0MC99_9ROSI
MERGPLEGTAPFKRKHLLRHLIKKRYPLQKSLSRCACLTQETASSKFIVGTVATSVITRCNKREDRRTAVKTWIFRFTEINMGYWTREQV